MSIDSNAYMKVWHQSIEVAWSQLLSHRDWDSENNDVDSEYGWCQWGYAAAALTTKSINAPNTEADSDKEMCKGNFLVAA